ncbi:uncharacterized protein LOC111628578 [Centruroides sculpturatus]|uniref:uncharacterized protein LOC111628578 n=1 Tax=Centruroides sculpturatus TaxID=218467 RepID=UPI000C6EACA4|nr:uncharacterized protein LOC111628578 [Centruroides sculpturatus]
MRFVIFLQFLFVMVNSCEQFWKNWGNVSCTTSANSCHMSSKRSSVEIFDESILINCEHETIDSNFLRCLNVKDVRNITFSNCYMSGMDFGIFTFGYKVENVKILYTINERNFESATFINLQSLKSVVIQGVRTSDLLHLIFINVPLLTSLQIKNYNFTLFQKRPFSNLINLSELHITNGMLKVLPEDLFYNLQNLTKLDLSENHIESFPPFVFRNLTRLEYLYLSWNEIKNLPGDMLKGLSNLKTLYIDRHKRLSEIPFGFFKGLHNLRELNAWGCSFSSLEENVFSDLINLTAIDLDLNQFEHLSENLLKNNKMLTIFSFSGNKITTLPRKIFHGLSNLKYINLLNNRLENLPQDVFLNLSSLQILILALNRLKHLPENIFYTLNNLLYLNLSYNNITHISGNHPFGKSNHLRHLDVSNAGLTVWPIINWTEYNLTTVDFANNHFETVNLPIYTPNDMKIDLSKCKIRTIYLDEWKYGFQMPTYDLNNNSITCDHKLEQFVFTLTYSLDVALKMFPNIHNMKCYGEGRNVLGNTKFINIGNHCPLNCECVAEHNNVKLNCSGRGIKKIPEAVLQNTTIVDLSNNYIKELLNLDFVRWENVRHLNLSNNSLINFPDCFLPPHVTFLSLDKNQLTELSPGLMNLIDTSKEFKISLSVNNWSCDCNSRFTKDWLLRNMQKIADFSKVSCQRNSFILSFAEIVSGDFCTRTEVIAISSVKWKIYVTVLSLVIVILLIVFVYIVYRWERKTKNRLYQKLGKMRFVIFLQFLFVMVNSCEQFWKNWGNVSCTTSANSCHMSSKRSSVEIFDESILINCEHETIDSNFLRCLNVKDVRNITFSNCYMSGMDFGIFTFGYKVENVKILYTINERNFESATFINLQSLKSVVIQGVRTSDLLHLIFINVPLLTSLQIKNYNFTLFQKRPFSNLINLSELHITNGMLKVLPEDLFYNLQNLTKLDLSENHIESFPPFVFRNLTRLEYLYLSWNEIKNLPGDMLKGLSNLKTLYIDRHKRLSEIPFGFFKGLHNLRELNAWGCSFSSLEENVFSDLINLTAIDLDLNQFEHLSENLLKNNKMLTIFSFSGNKITTLPRKIFHGLSNLKYINLLNNRLENLPQDVFLNLSSLQILILALNRLKHLPENIFYTLNNLLYLNLSYNNITHISGNHPFGKSNHLRHLDVSNAGLTVWPIINWTEYNLTTVDFANNHFETVNLPIYTPNDMKIDLSKCKIRTIYLDEWKYGFQMPTYDLNNNSITCDHKLEQFVFTLTYSLDVALKMFPNIHNMKCYGEGRNVLGNTKFINIGNHCPLNCECVAEHNNVKLNCSGRGIKKIPEAVLQNTTIVDLSNNYIKELLNLDFVRWENVRHLNLSNNSLINFPDCFLPPHVTFLSLDKNQLTELSPGLMNLIDTSKEFKISLSVNNWSCDCNSRFTKDWLLRNMQKIADFSKVSCQRNSFILSFAEIVSGDFCTRTEVIAISSVKWKIYVTVLSLVIVILLIVFVYIVYRWERKTKNRLYQKVSMQVR